MAVTKIHPIKSTLKKALDYIENPDKTDGKLFVSSYGCSYVNDILILYIFGDYILHFLGKKLTARFKQCIYNSVCIRHHLLPFF